MGRTGSHGIHVPWGPSIWGQCRGSSLVLRKPLTPESQGCGSFYSHVCHVTQEVYRLFMSPKPLCNMAPDAGTLVVTEWFHSSCRERLLWFMPSAFLDALRRNPIASGENRAHRCPDSYSLEKGTMTSTLRNTRPDLDPNVLPPCLKHKLIGYPEMVVSMTAPH